MGDQIVRQGSYEPPLASMSCVPSGARPAPTQEAAAELLDLPFSTYRGHLTRGLERIVDWLWHRELHGAGA